MNNTMKDNLRIAFAKHGKKLCTAGELQKAFRSEDMEKINALIEKANELDGITLPSVMALIDKGWYLETFTVNYRSSQDNDCLITETFSVLCKGFYKDGMPRMGYANKKAPIKYHTSCDDSFDCSCLRYEKTERYVGDGQFHDGFENVSRF